MTKTNTTKRLLFLFYCLVVLAVALVVVGEMGLIELSGVDAGTEVEFCVLSAMELLTVCSLPVALKMFKLKKVTGWIGDDTERYSAASIVRLLMIGVPMIVDIACYYVFMSVAFAYMAIISVLCLTFVYPSDGRRLEEMHNEN